MSLTTIAVAACSGNTDTDMIRGISSIAMRALEPCCDVGKSKQRGNAFRAIRKSDFRKHANK